MQQLHTMLSEERQNGRTVHVIFESRGRKEDRELELEFRRIAANDSGSGPGRQDFGLFDPAGVRAEGGELRRPATRGFDGAAHRAVAPASEPAQPRFRDSPTQNRRIGSTSVSGRGEEKKEPPEV